MDTYSCILCVIVGIVLIGGVVAVIHNEKRSIQSWLLLAVTEAEKTLGSGVGALKLRTVFENFVKLFPKFSKFVTFSKFSKWVDKALVQMRKMLETNKKVEEYIKGDE